FGSVPNFVPPLFCLYLVALAVFELFPAGAAWRSCKLGASAPLAVYALAVILQTLASIPSAGIVRSLLAMPLLVASHIFYGLGFWRGLFTRLHHGADRPKFEVVLEKVSV